MGAKKPGRLPGRDVGSAAGVADMRQALAQDRDHMVVIQAVKDALALPAGLDQVGVAQQPQLVDTADWLMPSCSARSATHSSG